MKSFFKPNFRSILLFIFFLFFHHSIYIARAFLSKNPENVQKRLFHKVDWDF